MSIEEEIAQAMSALYLVDGADPTAEDLAAAVMPLVKRAQAEAEARALREAAVNVRHELGTEAGGHTSTYSVRKWLNRRADRIENEGERA